VSDRAKLQTLIHDLCLLEGDFTLSTGARSRFYFDCKCVTLNGEGLTLIAKEFLREIERLPIQPDAIGGLTMGADFMTAAVIVLSHQTNAPIMNGSIVRKEAKKHGTKNQIENELPPGTKIVVVDDVITTGKSTLQACDEFEAAGYQVVGILAVVDREAGGMENLRQRYPHVTALFKKSDFPELKTVASNEQPTRHSAHAH
jgi:orotate phosphoribosyltransferase